MLVITYPQPTPSNNEVMRKYSHPQAKRRKRDETITIMRSCLPGGARNARIDQCEVTVLRFGHNLLDWDNMGGGLKFLIDALVHWQVIVDDKPTVITRLALEQEIDRSNPRTVISVKLPAE